MGFFNAIFGGKSSNENVATLIKEGAFLVDVRSQGEFADGHVKDAVNLPLNEMNDLGLIANIEERDNLYVHCAGGYRSVIASSLLKRHGFHNIRNVIGGFEKIKEQKIPVVKEASALN